MNNNIAIGFGDYDIEVSFIIANADKITSYGAVVAKHTQCIVTKNGLVIGFSTVVKHASDNDNPLYGCQLAMEKALSSTDLTKWERGVIWNHFKSDSYYDHFDPSLSPIKFEPTREDFGKFKEYLMDSIQKSIYSMPSDVCHKGLHLGNDVKVRNPMLNDKGTALIEGDEITTVGQLRYLMSELADCDRLALECIDEDGNLEDHYPLSVETYDGVGLPNGKTGKEFRICQRLQMSNDELIDKVINEKYSEGEPNIDEARRHLSSLTNGELLKILKL